MSKSNLNLKLPVAANLQVVFAVRRGGVVTGRLRLEIQVLKFDSESESDSESKLSNLHVPGNLTRTRNFNLKFEFTGKLPLHLLR